MDWQITSAILGALAAVLTIADLVYRHIQNKKSRRTQNTRLGSQNNSWVTRLYKKVRRVQCNVQIVHSVGRLYKKLQRDDYIPQRVEYTQQIKKACHA